MNILTSSRLAILIASTSATQPAASQWISQDPGFPANVQVVCISPVDENIVWVEGSNLFFPLPYQGYSKTTDGGMTWTTGTIPGVPNYGNSCIQALNADTAWVSMFDATGATSSGIFKTTDGGLTWSQQGSAFPDLGGFPDFAHFFDANNGVTMGDPNGGNFEIYTTNDGGENWLRVPPLSIPAPLPNEFGLAGNLTVAGDSSLWFGTNMGRVFHTANRGLSWEAAGVGLGQAKLGVAFQNESTGLAMAPEASNNIAKTTDGGATWNTLSTPPLGAVLAYVPGTDSTYMITSFGLEPSGSAYSFDGGESWTISDDLHLNKAFFVNPSIGWAGATFSNMVYKWAGPVLPVEESVSSDRLPTEFSLYQNFPNPFNPETNIRFSTPQASRVAITLHNQLGQLVRCLAANQFAAGTHRLSWYGRDESGAIVPSGIYFYRIQVVVGASSFTSTRKMVLVR